MNKRPTITVVEVPVAGVGFENSDAGAAGTLPVRYEGKHRVTAIT